MIKTFVKVKHFDKAEDFLTHLLPWKYNEVSTGQGTVFRGQTGDYPLIPNALRNNGGNLLKARHGDSGVRTLTNDIDFIKLEYDLLNQFFHRSDSSGLNVPPCNILRNFRHREISFEHVSTFSQFFTGIEWLPRELEELAGIGQHYGLPTRLLDWTYDPFVAAFFACKNAENADSNIVLWLFQVGNLGEVADHTNTMIPLRIITPPYSGNPNLAAQRGLFTHWIQILTTKKVGNNEVKIVESRADCRSLDAIIYDWLFETERECSVSFLVDGERASLFQNMLIFQKYTLPSSEARQASHLLAQLGYDHSRLFPGFYGVVKDILH